VKEIPGNKVQRDEKLAREFELLRSLPPHQNLVKYYGLFEPTENDNTYYLILEYCNGGDLKQYKKDNNITTMSEAEVKKIALQIGNSFMKFQDLFYNQVFLFRISFFLKTTTITITARGLVHLITHNAIHRDLKLENILVHKEENGEIVIKLTDFNKSRWLGAGDAFVKTFAGTPLYMVLFYKQLSLGLWIVVNFLIFISRLQKFLRENTMQRLNSFSLTCSSNNKKKTDFFFFYQADLWPLGLIIYELLYDKHMFIDCRDIPELIAKQEELIASPTNFLNPQSMSPELFNLLCG
jgi:serine/threonine protein kinase